MPKKVGKKHTQPEVHDKALTAIEQRFHLIMDHAPVLVWMSDTRKKRTWFSKPWLAFTGRGIKQELGDGWTENVHPEDLDRCLTISTISFD